MSTTSLTPEYLCAQIEVVRNAFSVMADMDMFPSATRPAFSDDLPGIGASISYNDQPCTTLYLECDRLVAYTFTERTMGTAPDGPPSDEVRDAIGELINTIGGSLKNLLPPGIQISCPQVFMLAASTTDDSEISCINCLFFTSSFGSLRLLIRDCDSPQRPL